MIHREPKFSRFLHKLLVGVVRRQQGFVVRALCYLFGPESVTPDERMWRLLEETAELAQSHGFTLQQCVDIFDVVYARPPESDIKIEIAGVFNTLLAYAEVRKVNVATLGRAHLEHVLLNHETYRAKNRVKHR